MGAVVDILICIFFLITIDMFRGSFIAGCFSAFILLLFIGLKYALDNQDKPQAPAVQEPTK